MGRDDRETRRDDISPHCVERLGLGREGHTARQLDEDKDSDALRDCDEMRRDYSWTGTRGEGN